MVTSSKAVLKGKFPQKHPTIKNADLERVDDNSAEIVREATGPVEVTGQMRGAGRQARVEQELYLLKVINKDCQHNPEPLYT